MEAVIFTGVQGSGKSTFYRERFVDTHIRINLDMLRTRHREGVLLEACLRGKIKFVVDNTNPTVEDRLRYIPPAKKAGFHIVGYCFAVSLEEIKRRNARRPVEQAVPLGGVLETYKRLQRLRYAEGFDELYSVGSEDGRFVIEPRDGDA